MTKTQLTKEIEKALIEKYCSNNLKKYYGALEVPCANWLGKGKQNIDFATYEPRTQDINILWQPGIMALVIGQPLSQGKSSLYLSKLVK